MTTPSELKFLTAVNPNYKTELGSCRDGFGVGLVTAGKGNKAIVALTADLAESTRVNLFAEAYPERFVEVGVAEQNMAGVAAGLALGGKIPFLTSYAVFSPGRNWDQLRVSICYSNLNVKLVGAHAGISVGPDGATHQALEDIAITRVLPNLTVIVPADELEAQRATIALAEHQGPVYLRFGREKSSVITTSSTPFVIGKALPILQGKDVTIIACGQMVAQSLRAIEKMSGAMSIGLINMHTIKPIDRVAIINAAKFSGAVVTVEEHQVSGGLGSAVTEVLAECYPVPVVRVGVPDKFGESGEPKLLMEHYGLSVDDIVSATKRAVELKNAR